jgi:copper chaperone
MASIVIAVGGMTCSHCVHAVQTEIGKLPGVSAVEVDLGAGSVTIEAEPLPGPDALREAIAEAGYELAG